MRKILTFITAIAAIYTLTGCKSTRNVVSSNSTIVASATNEEDINFLRKVTDNYQYAQFFTSKVKFSASMNGQGITLSGNLKMHRDDVIQISLTALGFIEAARIELTPEYALLIDRLHKCYVKEKYEDFDFLKDNGLNYYAMQSLFWNEFFCPGKQSIGESDLQFFSVNRQGNNAAITLADEAKPKTALMKATTFKWQAGQQKSKITSAAVSYADGKEKAHITWNYSNFATFSRKQFPMTQAISIATPELNLKANIEISNPNNNSDWDYRTKLSDKYQKVTIEQLFSQLTKF